MRKEVLVGVVVGAALLAIGVPVGLLGAVLQDKVTAKDPAEPVVTADYIPDNMAGRSVLFRGARALPAGVDKRTGCAGRAVARGAVDFQATPVRVEVTGVEGHTVAIKDIRAKVVHSATPLAGVALTCTTEGSASATEVAIELDEPEPAALEVPFESLQPFISTKRYFDGRFHYVESQKPEVFEVTSYARTRDHDWVLEVVGSVDGKDRVWTLDDHGRPFHTAGALPAPPYPSDGRGGTGGRDSSGREWGVDTHGVKYRFFDVSPHDITEYRNPPDWYRPELPERCSPPNCPAEEKDD